MFLVLLRLTAIIYTLQRVDWKAKSNVHAQQIKHQSKHFRSQIEFFFRFVRVGRVGSSFDIEST